MKNSSQRGQLSGLLLGFFAFQGTSSATTTFDIEVIPGVTQLATSVSDSNITQADMSGMLIEAFFSTPAGEIVITSHWSGSAGGYVPGGDGKLIGFTLGVSGPTSVAPWILRNESHPDTQAALTGIRIDGFGSPFGRTVFDLTFGGAVGTPGSGTGRDFYSDLDLGFPLHVVATYRDQVAVAGNTAVGDLFRVLELDLGDVITNPSFPLYFYVVIDNVNGPTPVDPPGTAPEPGTLLLLGAGLAALHRRRRM